MDFVQKLRVFVTVVEHGSFTRAADALAMSRPSVTNSIADLEQEVGARLLHRTTRRSALTTEGALFYDRATEVLSTVGEARNFFGGGNALPRGRLRIDMPNSIAKPVIIPRLHEFFQKYPEIELALGVSDRPVDLIADGIDCVLRIGETTDSSLISSVICHLPVVTVASPDYIEKYGTPKSIQGLDGHRGVNYFVGRSRRVLDWHFVVNGEDVAVRMKQAILVNDGYAYTTCALNGIGLAQAPRLMFHEDLVAGRLVEVLPELSGRPRPVYVMYPARQYLAPQVRVFVDWVKSIFVIPDTRWTRVG
ncbi:LysR family transcriptional regulator (plasmid) [Shinella sp. H4-D48]|uniref:LysR family transcriptional regulator n=1 Tax=Shinella sp. H4-D48 TaxID=2925841 RepID=UPI001F53D094|nr:LysR family transcriptional regulator [Shinella sp. H4-D48]UNK39972.1 LysR family transcriptional regulator [Shinella sp. H4-D48]